LAEHFGSMYSLQQASVDDLSEINEVGPVIAQSVYDFVHSNFGAQAIKDLAKIGVSMQAERVRTKSGVAGTLAGKTLVVTGTLQKYKREEIEELITRHGGHAASSVSKNTDYLVAGEKAGSKLDKAKQLGIKILTEAEFDKLIAT
jgi:DNA ligase (NAD+)